MFYFHNKRNQIKLCEAPKGSCQQRPGIWVFCGRVIRQSQYKNFTKLSCFTFSMMWYQSVPKPFCQSSPKGILEDFFFIWLSKFYGYFYQQDWDLELVVFGVDCDTMSVPVVYKQLKTKQCRRDIMVVGFTTTCAISAYHHGSCEFESRSWRGIQHYVIKFVNDLRKVCGFLQILRFPPSIKLTARI